MAGIKFILFFFFCIISGKDVIQDVNESHMTQKFEYKKPVTPAEMTRKME